MHETTSAGSAAGLRELPLEKLREFSPLIEEDVFAALHREYALAARTHHGAASAECVREAVRRAREELARAGGGDKGDA